MAEEIKELEKMYKDTVQEVFEGKTIFITGGTGFLGKVLVEKLLRCCNPKRIYMLVRDKKGKEPRLRLREIFQNPLFETLRKQKGDGVFDKCVPISGDVSLLGMGISREDRETLISDVEIVYHGAATIRFDEPLKRAVLLNARGTKQMLQLAGEMRRLQLFVHISTSYCHLGEKVLYERVYPPPADPNGIIDTVEWMDEQLVDAMTPTLLGDIPNTYAFTKALGEALVAEQIDKLPVMILRPSVVVPIWKEPLPGWTDNINGPTGLLIGAGKGVIRTMYCKQDGYADFVPVDVVANACLVTVWNRLVNKNPRPVYNVCSSAEFKISWQEIVELGKKVVYEKVPLNGVAWYPGGSMKNNWYVHRLCVILFHYIPAILIDTIMFCIGQKRFMWRIQQRITKGFDVFEYYANNQWDFNNEDSLNERNLMNPLEKAKYKLDGDGLDYFEYFSNCTHAARLYILKETDDTLPAARRHMKVMYVVDRLTKALFWLLVAYLLYKHVVLPVMSIF